jgi:toxin secretion/phage lysis holin
MEVREISKEQLVDMLSANLGKLVVWGTTILGTSVSWLFGVWDLSFQVLVTLTIMDYITGLLKGYVNNSLSSATGFKGLTKKCLILIILIVAVSLDRLIGQGTWVTRTVVCWFYIANEGLSIIENCGELGLPIPQKLKDALQQLNNKE